MRKSMFMFLSILLSALIVGCSGAGANAVKNATARDTIFSIETKENGSHFIWLTHDDVGVYCTMDDKTFQKAVSIFMDKTHSPEVLLGYISNNLGTEENKTFFQDPLGVYGCKHDKATIYIITSVISVNAQ